VDLKFLETIIPAILTGGGSAIGSSLAFLKDIRSRLDSLEKKVGSKDHANGISHEILLLQGQVKELTSKVDSLTARLDSQNQRPPSLSDFDPRSSSAHLGGSVNTRLSELTDSVDAIKRKIQHFVLDDDFESADRVRGNQYEELRSSVATLKGLLEGLREGLGIAKRSR